MSLAARQTRINVKLCFWNANFCVLQANRIPYIAINDMPTLVIARHGQSVWNKHNMFTGWIDVDLTEKGIAEAHLAADKIRDIEFDVAFTSMLRRAQRTLNIMMKHQKDDIEIHKAEELNERMYGDLQGLNKDEVREQFGKEQVQIWRRSYDIGPPNGESLQETSERVVPYYNAKIVPELEAERNVIVAAHGNSLRALIKHIEGLSPEEIVKVEVPTGSPIFYEFDNNLKLLKIDRPGRE